MKNPVLEIELGISPSVKICAKTYTTEPLGTDQIIYFNDLCITGNIYAYNAINVNIIIRT